MRRHLLVFLIVATAVASAAAQEGKYRAPRTETGRPDLQGVWSFNTGVPLQRPAASASRWSLRHSRKPRLSPWAES